MKRTTIFADEELLEQLREISAEEKSSVAETMRKAMRSYVQQRRRKKRKLSFVGIASSGRKDIAERHEDLLWKKNTK
ncbi:ribbon-helix-helix protein, CopG family [bacterium]|nr:ribbon-helix-helix protein, CopG family [bacterium]